MKRLTNNEYRAHCAHWGHQRMRAHTIEGNAEEWLDAWSKAAVNTRTGR